MYERELLAKALVVEDILECADHSTALLYIASWQMQPFVEKAKLDDILKAIHVDCFDSNETSKRKVTHKVVK